MCEPVCNSVPNLAAFLKQISKAFQDTALIYNVATRESTTKDEYGPSSGNG
jgi:hypothetical protein